MTDSTSTHQSEAEAPRNGSRRRLAVGILLVSVLLMLAAGAWWWHQLQTTVSTDNAKVTGDITDISPKTGGRLEELLVAEGDQVRAGQLLARLDSSQAEVALAQAQAALALAEANLAKLPDEVRAARATVERNRQTAAAARAQVGVAETTLADSTRALQQAQALFDSGAVSREALDSATSRQRSARAALEAAQA
ncbi:MAG: biotin/lipoyl-binding protein, partial [Syntrophomonadaceae bacterium]|nr:biotin/lipoyl-binding protein [Syntrophomonadaceae bacterium]